MITRRNFLASGMLAALYRPLQAMATVDSSQGTPWRNWSGYLNSNPANRLAPRSEDELIAVLKATGGALRPVGSGHSFSPLVPTDGTLVVLDNLSGLVSSDPVNNTAILSAGTRLADAGPILESVGQAMFNLPDIDRQTLAGAVSTSTHGTGVGLGSLSRYVNYLRLITPTGEVLDLSRELQPELFDAARVSMGSLGLITKIGFENRSTFKLKSSIWVEKTADVIDSFNERADQYEHYEFMPFVHSDYSLVVAHAETDDVLKAPAPAAEGGDEFALLAKVPVMMRRPIINYLLQDLESDESVQTSHMALTNIRNGRFNEMEYSVPVDAGLECVREVLATIADLGIDVVMPLEYRVVGKDDTWLSMFSGEAKASISIHRMAGLDYRPYFDLIEPIFWKYGGRPHWGKVHSLGYEQLSKLYPRLDDFVALQKDLDPQGRMLNTHLKNVFGLS